MSIVYLTGFMGSGKTTVGRMVAQRLNAEFVDLDEVISRSSGMSISQMFAEQGEESFRDRESAALEQVAAEAGSVVVATGGGVVLRPQNRTLMAQTGTVVFLKAGLQDALTRVGDDPGRPLLRAGAITVEQLYDARQALYLSSADLVVDTHEVSPEQVADRVVEGLS